MTIRVGTKGRIVDVDGNAGAAFFDGARAKVLERLYHPDAVVVELLDDGPGWPGGSWQRGTRGHVYLRYFVPDPKPAKRVSATGRRGVLSGIGRVAGRKIVYVKWPDGTLSDYTLTAFRRAFGVAATSLPTGGEVLEIAST